MTAPPVPALACPPDSVPAAQAHARFLASRYFPSLDGLRCLAILPVIWHHSTPRPLEGFLGRGPLGVDLFFAISGFLITTLLLRERFATGQMSLAKFYARRTLRIFPLYYTVLALHVAWALWGLPADSPIRSHFFESLPAHATYTTNWLVDFSVAHPVLFSFSWSLATEEQFYLIWPGVMRAARRWWGPIVFTAALLAVDQSADFGYLSRILDWQGLPFRILSSVAAPICLGALLAHALHHPRSFRVLEPVLSNRFSAPAALLSLLALVAWRDSPLWVIHLAMAALVGTTCIRADHGLRRFTDSSPVRFVGTISYGMYLFHVGVIGAVKRALPQGWGSAPVVFGTAMVLTMVIAYASHRYFETIFLRLRDRFRADAPRRRRSRGDSAPDDARSAS